FFLIVWKQLDDFFKIYISLIFYHLHFNTIVRELQNFKNIETIVIDYVRCSFLFPEMVDDHVMGNTHDPRQELTFIIVSTSFKGIDHFDKSLLENIFS